MEAWHDFKGTKWKKTIDVANFIETNYTEYLNDASFLSGISKKTNKLLKKYESLIKKENISSILDVETDLISGIDSYNPGYIDSKEELIVGLQTDEALKRSISLSSGTDIVKKNIERYGFRLDSDIESKFNEYAKTYNEAINQIFSDEIKKIINNHVLDGLPTDYDRGRIIGDYRRIALYGVDYIIAQKKEDIKKLSQSINTATIRLIEELNEQIKSLNLLKKMAKRYEIDISSPALTAKDAIQYLYFAYLGYLKQNHSISNGLGRNITFIDIYIERDLKNGIITENEAQELIDQLVLKLRMVRYINSANLTIGSPLMITECIGGMLDDNRSFVTKSSYRILKSLINLGNYSEPNIKVLWSTKLPNNFKNYVSHIYLTTNCLQFENDDIIRKIFGTDYAISDSVSPLMLGKQMQLYGSQLNLPKTLLYALNGGRDEITNEVVIDGIEQIEGEYLDYDRVVKVYESVLKKVIGLYVDALNITHEMHDKYHYESLPMALHNTLISRVMAFGISGLTCVVDSLSAIKYGKVRVKRDKNGLTHSFDINTEYPTFGNNDIRVDEITGKLLAKIYQLIKKRNLYRNSEPTISIISNELSIIYGKKTGATPNGRKSNVCFNLDANPNVCSNNLLYTLSSLSKIPFKLCLDGISNTLFIEPSLLGLEESRTSNLVHLIDNFFKQSGTHLTLNTISKEKLNEVYYYPNKYQNIIVGISGYLVEFIKLSKEEQEYILNQNFYNSL